ncbi:MAG: SDR family NAD(P)-dependent oxidoreductase [Aquabacterium sp.]|nr:SDR family NAD(P)-dependent oxidoreductase [Aquabacterium sp.]
MHIESGQIAALTGGGTGIGRALALQLSAMGVHVAMCDVSAAHMAETQVLCLAGAPAGTRVTCTVADVSQESAVLAFRDAVRAEHHTDHIHLLFNNAGTAGGGAFVNGNRADWERTFNIDWFGVYYSARAFLPMLVASPVGCIVNVSSVNGFWASLGPGVPHTAYSAAKFAVKGFTEALITDLRTNAPHVGCVLVMPGHVGTSIALNTYDARKMPAALVGVMRQRMVQAGAPVADASDDDIRALMHQRAIDFRDKAPTTAAQAAATILDGVRAGRWRILVGEDAHRLDAMVRQAPEDAYEPAFAAAWRDGGPA